jgi:hypothetical protein
MGGWMADRTAGWTAGSRAGPTAHGQAVLKAVSLAEPWDVGMVVHSVSHLACLTADYSAFA